MSAQHANRAERRAAGVRGVRSSSRVQLADVDHGAKVIRGRVELARPGPCPHVRAAWSQEAGRQLVGQCTGEEGHLSRRHADQYGRVW